MNLLRLSTTMSCRSRMPAVDRSSSFVMWSFYYTPIISRRHLLLNTMSILFVLSVVLLHVSLEWMADGMTIDVYRCIFVFLLIFCDLHTGRRHLYTDETSPSVCICHSRHHRLMICCCQGTASAPQTLCLCAPRSGMELVCF